MSLLSPHINLIKQGLTMQRSDRGSRNLALHKHTLSVIKDQHISKDQYSRGAQAESLILDDFQAATGSSMDEMLG